MFTIYPDCPVSRRLRIHYVMDKEDKLAFSSPTLDACVAWLIDQGETRCLIQGERIDRKYTVTMEFGC